MRRMMLVALVGALMVVVLGLAGCGGRPSVVGTWEVADSGLKIELHRNGSGVTIREEMIHINPWTPGDGVVVHNERVEWRTENNILHFSAYRYEEGLRGERLVRSFIAVFELDGNLMRLEGVSGNQGGRWLTDRIWLRLD